MLPNHILEPTSRNAPGVVPELLFAPKIWFNVIAVPPTTETNPGDDIVITANHTFLTNDPAYGFVKLQMTDRTAELFYKQVGELGSEGIDGEIEGFSSGLNVALLSLMSKPLDAIVLVQDLNCSTVRYYQLGTSCSVARKKGWQYSTGKAGGEGRKGTTVKFNAYMESPLIYTGAVTYAEQPPEAS